MTATLASRSFGPLVSARWLRVWMCFLIIAVGYIDRTNLAVAAPFIKADLHVGDATMGLVLGSFYWTYALLQVPAGVLIDRISLRTGVAAAVSLWSLATIGTAFAWGAAVLFLCRLLLGAGEAPIYPAASRLVAADFAPHERGRACGTFQCGIRGGALIAVPLVSAIIAAGSWRLAFVITGGLGFLVAGAWLLAVRDPPAPPAAIQAAAKPASTPAAIWAIARHRCFIGIGAGSLLALIPGYFFFTWFPAYLLRARHYTLAELATFGALPMLAGVPAPFLWGALSDGLIRRGWSVSGSRRTCMSGAAAFGALMMAAPFVHSNALLIGLFCLASAGLSGITGLVFASAAEMAPAPSHVGTITGMINCFGNLAGIVSPALVGVLLARSGGSFDTALIVMGACALASAVTYGWGAGEIVRIPQYRAGAAAENGCVLAIAPERR